LYVDLFQYTTILFLSSFRSSKISALSLIGIKSETVRMIVKTIDHS
jgi:hypothetical protein